MTRRKQRLLDYVVVTAAIIATALVLCGTARTAHAEGTPFTARALVDMCHERPVSKKDKYSPGQLLCLYSVRSFADGVLAAGWMDKKANVCMDDRLLTGDLVQIVTMSWDTHPERRGWSASALMGA